MTPTSLSQPGPSWAWDSARDLPRATSSCGAGTQRSPGSSSDLSWAFCSTGTGGRVPAHDRGGSVCLHTEDQGAHG